MLDWKLKELTEHMSHHASVENKKPFAGMKGSWLIVHKGQKVLLAHRFPGSSSDPNKWDWFGGGVDSGESPKDAAIREFREEAGYDFSSLKDQVRPLLAVANPIQGGKCYFFCVEAPPDLKIELNHEHDRWAWFGLNQIQGMALQMNWPTATSIGALLKYLED
jgi:8-oxo-dGTP pyrophosphatase MutT (NUDIX family)